MRASRLAATILALSPLYLFAQNPGALAGPKGWKVVRSEEAPPGTSIEFAADGKLTLTLVVDGKARQMTGTYTVAGDQLTLRVARDGKERVETRTIKKLTDTTLVTEDRNHKVEELERQR